MKKVLILAMILNVSCGPSGPDFDEDNAFEYLGGDNPVRDAFKMRSAWNIKTPPGYSCFYVDPFLHQNKLPILGTQYTSIDLAEDRDRFRNLLNKLKLKQAESGIAKTYKEAIKIADKIGLPLMVRPSYVLGGRAMEIVYEKGQLRNFIEEAFKAAEKNPILIDKFIDHAMEVDVDAISDGKEVYVAGIMQHIEEAGIHSGDSACSLPPISIKPLSLIHI